MSNLRSWNAAAAMLAAAATTAIVPPAAAKRRGEYRSAVTPKPLPPHNQSFRSLRRAFNTGGFVPPPLTVEERMRHKWFRNHVAWAALRVKIGQEQPGDAALLREVEERERA